MTVIIRCASVVSIIVPHFDIPPYSSINVMLRIWSLETYVKNVSEEWVFFVKEAKTQPSVIWVVSAISPQLTQNKNKRVEPLVKDITSDSGFCFLYRCHATFAHKMQKIYACIWKEMHQPQEIIFGLEKAVRNMSTT